MPITTRAFTLLEGLVTLAVLSVLAVVSAPSFIQLIHAQQLRNASQDLVQAFILARHEAITRQEPVLIGNQDGLWSSRWEVFVDHNDNGIFDAGDVRLRSSDAVAVGVRIDGNTPVSHYVRYTPTGEAKMLSGAFQAGTITLCHEDGMQAIRKLVLSASGRLRTITEAAGSC